MILQRAEVGGRCVLAAGAVVKEGATIPPGSMVAGVPGRVRALSEAAAGWIDRSAEHYVELGQKFSAELGRRGLCELCGGATLERHCKVTCLNCGVPAGLQRSLSGELRRQPPKRPLATSPLDRLLAPPYCNLCFTMCNPWFTMPASFASLCVAPPDGHF